MEASKKQFQLYFSLCLSLALSLSHTHTHSHTTSLARTHSNSGTQLVSKSSLLNRHEIYRLAVVVILKKMSSGKLVLNGRGIIVLSSFLLPTSTQPIPNRSLLPTGVPATHKNNSKTLWFLLQLIFDMPSFLSSRRTTMKPLHERIVKTHFTSDDSIF